MIKELKTWLWECSSCREVSAPVKAFWEPRKAPAGWVCSTEPHCDDYRCSSTTNVDLCPDCAAKKGKK